MNRVLWVALLSLSFGCLVEDLPGPDAESPTESETESPTPNGPVSVLAASHSIAPRGSAIVLTGTGFVNVTSLVIGGTDQTAFTVDSDTQITIGAIDAATALGPREVVVTADEGSSSGFELEISVVDVPPLSATSLNVGDTRTIEILSFPGFDPIEVTTVTLGGVAQTVVNADALSVEFGPIDAATPLGTGQSLDIANGPTTIAPVVFTTISLSISEIDCDTVGADADEFIEIDAGVAGVTLDGYALVQFNGANDLSYQTTDLGQAQTNADGLMVVGNANVNPDITIGNNSVQQGPDAVALFSNPAFTYPDLSPIDTAGLIDAVVYSTGDADDAGLLLGLLGDAMAIQEDEDLNGSSDTESIARCNPGNLDTTGAAFEIVPTPSPGQLNAGFCP